MAIDLDQLWDFNNPGLSEQRFRQTLAQATGDDALILRTQIARTHGMRLNFEAARKQLLQIEPAIKNGGPEAQARYQLELGRSYASAKHKPEDMTPAGTAQARRSFEVALRTARAAGLDALAIDAIHMFAFLDSAPIDQLHWAHEALTVVKSSVQPNAQRWEPSIRNNIGYALHQLGRYEEALLQFQQATVLRERGTNERATRVAHWMVAWTLRSLNRIDEALEIQLRLERKNDEAGEIDPYVFEELESLYLEKDDRTRAQHYAKKKTLARGS